MTSAPPQALSELRAWPHWVIYRVEERDGKPTKVPYMAAAPTRRASSTDPETWSTYDQARQAASTGRAAGVGYVFSPDDEYAGVDLDDCVTDGKVHDAALEIVRRLDSYTELSPTGTGLHIFVRARINGDRKRTGKTPWGGEFETYDQGRFFTVTAKWMRSTPAVIEARQEELDALRAELLPAAAPAASSANGKPTLILPTTASTLDDVELLEKIRGSKQGPRFTELYDRGAPEGQESEADLGLCNILAFWLGPDEARIDAWFRRSALLRDKWDDKRGDTTYGGYTIARALEGRTAFYGQKASASRPKDDNTEMSYAEEISTIFGIIDDPIVAGWRSSKKATTRVVFTTKSGEELDLDSWKAVTGSPAALAQEIGVQLGVEVTLKKEDIKRLNVLLGKFCDLHEVMTHRDRAYELGMTYLQEAERIDVDLADQASRWSTFNTMKDRNPAVRAKAENTGFAAACIVLDDRSGKRYTRIQWFVDYVKTCAVAGTASIILDHIEEPGNWDRIQNAKSQMKATDPETGKHIWQVLYEIPAGWGDE